MGRRVACALVSLTLAGAATGHWFLRYTALPDGLGGFKFDDPYMVEANQPHDENAPILAAIAK